MATATSLRAVSLLRREPPEKAACMRFVGSGGISDRPGGKPTVLSTAMGLMALGELGRMAAASLKKEQSTVDAAVRFVEKNARTIEEIRMALAGMEAVGVGPAKAKAWYDLVLSRERPEPSSDSLRSIASALAIDQRLNREAPPVDELKTMLTDGQSADGGAR